MRDGVLRVARWAPTEVASDTGRGAFDRVKNTFNTAN